ncbi:MAG: hypothetical protein J5758_04555, partial [Abditibacteriota bacterium]|nr:hypothetical protein [Abditibacteriota bacterium]
MTDTYQYTDPGEEKQMLDLLWDQYNEGEYADCVALAESILENSPENVNALSVLALVYEKLADANREAGDTEGEREYLSRALENYLKIIQVSHDSVAEQVKAERLKQKLYGSRKRSGAALPVEDIKKALGRWSEKVSLWYRENKDQKRFRVMCVIAACCVFVSAGVISYAVSVHNSREAARRAAEAKALEEMRAFAPETAQAPGVPAGSAPATGAAPYSGPMMTYTYQSPEYKAQLEAQQQEANANRRVVRDPNTLVDKGSHIKAGGTEPRREQDERDTKSDWYASRREQPKSGSKVPYTDFELRPAQGEEGAGEGVSPLTVERDTPSDKDKDGDKTKHDGSARLKAANNLLKSAIRAGDMGNYDEMRKSALAAKDIYQEELAKGNKPEFCKSNI